MLRSATTQEAFSSGAGLLVVCFGGTIMYNNTDRYISDIIYTYFGWSVGREHCTGLALDITYCASWYTCRFVFVPTKTVLLYLSRVTWLCCSLRRLGRHGGGNASTARASWIAGAAHKHVLNRAEQEMNPDRCPIAAIMHALRGPTAATSTLPHLHGDSTGY